jgi:hypothetical protein
MPKPGLRDHLLRLLARKDLRSETVALVADVVSVDARFNASVAEKKRSNEDVDIFGLAGTYEAWLEACEHEVSRFESSMDERALAEALQAARDALRREVIELGASF